MGKRKVKNVHTCSSGHVKESQAGKNLPSAIKRQFCYFHGYFCCILTSLVFDNGVPTVLNLQTFVTGFQSLILRNHKLLSCCANWQNGKPVKAVTKLMLMLVQANAVRNSHYQTLITRSTLHPKLFEYDGSLLGQIQVFTA